MLLLSSEARLAPLGDSTWGQVQWCAGKYLTANSGGGELAHFHGVNNLMPDLQLPSNILDRELGRDSTIGSRGSTSAPAHQ